MEKQYKEALVLYFIYFKVEMKTLLSFISLLLIFTDFSDAISCHNGTTSDGSVPNGLLIGCSGCTVSSSALILLKHNFILLFFFVLFCNRNQSLDIQRVMKPMPSTHMEVFFASTGVTSMSTVDHSTVATLRLIFSGRPTSSQLQQSSMVLELFKPACQQILIKVAEAIRTRLIRLIVFAVAETIATTTIYDVEQLQISITQLLFYYYYFWQCFQVKVSFCSV